MWGCQHPAVFPAPKQQLMSLNTKWIMWAKFCSLQISKSSRSCLWISKINYAISTKRVEGGDYHCLCELNITVIFNNWTIIFMIQIFLKQSIDNELVKKFYYGILRFTTMSIKVYHQIPSHDLFEVHHPVYTQISYIVYFHEVFP
jgi:hypothetical protein